MKLIISGGRNYNFTEEDYKKLYALLPKITEIVSGGSSGADQCGELWARNNGVRMVRFCADWIRFGPSAGPKRNAEMALYADAVILFPGGRGTENMYKNAVKQGLTIYDYRGKNDN